MSDFQPSGELLSIYLEDARGHLEALDQCLLALGREGLDSETAPSSGHELRSNFKTQPDVQATKAKEEWNKSVRGIQERVNKLNDERKQPATEPMEAEATA